MKRSAPPNYWLAVSATVLLISLMAYVRLVVFPHEFVPLAYAVFMLVALWHRDRRLLWTMAGSFLVVVLVKMTMVMPESAVPLPTRLLFSGMQMTNILVPAAIVHAVLNLRERLESTIGVMERTNSELETTNEELAAREEEINQQNEELQSQAVELEQQVEEASAQAEELHALNSQLAARERMLSDLLQPSVTEGTEAEVLERLGQKIVRLLGDRAAGALLSEPRDGVMAVYPLFGVADGPHEMPRRQSLSDLVASRDRAALLADTALRSDLEFPTLASGTPAASVISAPLRTPDGGALEVYAAEPEAWSDEDLRLVQWLAVQCGRLWGNARLRDGLERQRMLLRTVTDHASAALFLSDEHGRCTYMNPSAERLAGITASEARGRPLHDLLHGGGSGEPHTASDCPLHRCAGQHEDVVVRADGSDIPVMCSVAPVTQDGAVRSVVVEIRDMRELKRAQAERERLLQLERAAREEAEHACRARDDFVATLSHELRTPLNAVLGWATLLHGAVNDPEEVRNGVEVIERNARHQAQLISDLLDMTRITAGKVSLNLQPVDPAHVIETALQSARPQISAKNLTVHRSLDAAGRMLSADPERVQQIVWNLLTNAIKFTQPGGAVRVELSTEGPMVQIVVADDGQGIDASVLPYMFDRYRQADGSSTRRQGGLGIGLAIVKHLVELHGGTVRLESPGVGKGTTCTVLLPSHEARRGGRLEGVPAVATDSDAMFVGAGLDGLTFLVVDDEHDARTLVARLLTDRGAIVRTASSADEAMTVLCAEAVDMLISDIGMPGADGYSLVRRVRMECPEHVRGLPAIALTAFARSSDRTQAMLAGFHAHVSKPVEPPELLATVATLRNAMLGHRPRAAEQGSCQANTECGSCGSDKPEPGDGGPPTT
jgi:PAS domain S-box-containing protein